MNKQTELMKLTKKELVEKLMEDKVEKEAPKEVVAIPTFDLSKYKEDSFTSELIREGLLKVASYISSSDVIKDVVSKTNKFNINNYVTAGGNKASASHIRESLRCRAGNVDELNVWLQHVSVILNHELTRAVNSKHFKASVK